MFETERKHMSKHAYDLSLQLLRNRWKEASTFTSKKAAVVDICRTHQKIMRNLGYREDILNLLTEAYINFVGKSLEKVQSKMLCSYFLVVLTYMSLGGVFFFCRKKLSPREKRH